MQTMSNAKLVRRLLFIVVGMFAFGFALVPLYDVFCDLTGLNGRTVKRADIGIQTLVDNSRNIRVEFVTMNKTGLQTNFKALAEHVDVHPGEMKEVTFTVSNELAQVQTVQAVPSVSPGQAGLYFNKTECFCFYQQDLPAGKQTEFKLKFFVDKDLPKDIKVLTLAYTLYPIDKQELASNL